MARIEGTGIKTPSKKSIRLAGNQGPSTPVRIDTGVDINTGKPYKRVFQDFGAGRVGEIRLKKAEADIKRPNYFSPGGGAFDERNNVQVASASGDFSGTFNQTDFNSYVKGLGIKRPKALPPTMQRMLRENYQDDLRDGRYKEGQFINQAPVKEKPSFVEQTKNLAGSIFNTVTGTQPAAASQIPGAMTGGTQFSSSNLDAARAPVGSVTTGDTSFSSFRMAGQPSVEEKKNIVTPFSQTSMGRGEPIQVTPFSETSMAKDKPTVTAPTVSPSPTTPKTLAERQASKTYEQNRQKEGEKFADRGEREAINASGFQQANVRGSAFNTGKDESKRPKTVTIDGQTVAARQTVASLPSNYKQTEAQAFAKTAAFKEAQKIAAKNPNVKVGVDSKGQPKATAVQKSRTEAKATTAKANAARVKSNAKAKAQAAAVNRKMSGTKPKTAKERAQDAAKARKAAGPNRKMSAGQVTRSQAGASARTAQGNRARVKANARKRAQAAARKRRAKKKGKKGKK